MKQPIRIPLRPTIRVTIDPEFVGAVAQLLIFAGFIIYNAGVKKGIKMSA
jgi:hypothetical protein